MLLLDKIRLALELNKDDPFATSWLQHLEELVMEDAVTEKGKAWIKTNLEKYLKQ